MVLAVEELNLYGLAENPDLVGLKQIVSEPVQEDYDHSFLGRVSRLLEPNFNSDFNRELQDPKTYISTDGSNIPMTYRVFNQEYLNNGNPIVVYNFSLFVPGHRGAELPSVFEITKVAREHNSAVVAITTDGYDQPLTNQQLLSLHDFKSMANRKLDLLESISTNGQELIITGASLGGMMSYEMAALNSKRLNPKLKILEIISICSSGHNAYSPSDLSCVFRQFTTGEIVPAAKYLVQDLDPLSILKRSLEMVQTLPTSAQQVMASSIIAYSILHSPLVGVEKEIPPETIVIDELYADDKVSQPQYRNSNWKKAREHPKNKHRVLIENGNHLTLLTHGLMTTLHYLFLTKSQL